MIISAKNTFFLSKFYCFLVCFFCFNLSYSQTNTPGVSPDLSFKNYVKNFEEVTYVHLNKSTYLKGEQIGFTVYVFNKSSKRLSFETKNVYLKIFDDKNEIVTEQLLKVDKGIAFGTILLDTKYVSGNYRFIAFTNWMLNFSKQNIFNTTFKVIEATTEIANQNKTSNNSKIDVQVLPESGHFLDNVFHTAGIIVKDSDGKGIPNLEGVILENKDTISQFNLNELGIGRFSIKTKKNKTYTAVFEYDHKKVSHEFLKAVPEKGVLISLKKVNNTCFVSIKTNNKTLKELKKPDLLLTFHNGKEITKLPIQFLDSTVVLKKIPLSKLTPGITVFTLFKNNKPIAERLFFIYDGIKTIKSIAHKVDEKDSITSFSFSYPKNKALNNFNTVSVSVLPQSTKSYNSKRNIIAQVFLNPYIKGFIENENFYFENVNRETKYYLDNLLITQGWSSYDWTEIFKTSKREINYIFEEGLSVIFEIPKQKNVQQLFVHQTKYNPSKFIDIYKNTTKFPVSNFYLFNDEKLNLSEVNFKGKLIKPFLKIEFAPKKIPEFNISTIQNRPLFRERVKNDLQEVSNFSNINETEILEEITLTTNLEKERRARIKGRALGRVFFKDENDSNQTLVDYLNSKPGIIAISEPRIAQIVVKNKITNEACILILNGLEVTGDILFNYWMEDIDYIEIDTSPPLFLRKNLTGGTITIKTKKNINRSRSETIATVAVPLTFTKSKKYYQPKYLSYKNALFNNYGVIHWLPNAKIENGNLQVDIKDLKIKNLTFFIQGTTEDGKFIFEKKNIELK